MQVDPEVQGVGQICSSGCFFSSARNSQKSSRALDLRVQCGKRIILVLVTLFRKIAEPTFGNKSGSHPEVKRFLLLFECSL